jgi:hypothetical protein
MLTSVCVHSHSKLGLITPITISLNLYLNFSPIDEQNPKLNEMIHLDITISQDLMEEQVSLHEQDYFNKTPGPSSKGKQWSIPPNEPSQITHIILPRKL